MARVNIRDVANRVEVSTAAVSHVIGQICFVYDETHHGVLEVVEALNYQPTTVARELAINTTQTIGLIISSITTPFFTAIARGVEDGLV